MGGVIEHLKIFIEAHQLWAAPVVGLISFGESLALIGLLIPATAVMMLIGGIIGSGLIAPVPVLIFAVLGAVVGDIVSYAFGRWAGRGAVHRRPLRGYRESVARTRLFFRRYGFAAVFIGRFLGPIRSTVPLVAGMMAMDHTRFQIANVVSAIVWAPLMLAPGWLAARGAGMVGGMTEGHWLGIAGIAGILALATTAAAARLARRPEGRRRRRGRAGNVNVPTN